jgi:hypothetical protein
MSKEREAWGRRYRTVSGDPRWIRAKYPGVAQDGTPFKKGDEVLYWPKGKVFMVGKEAEQAWREFESQAADEEFYNQGRWGSTERKSSYTKLLRSVIGLSSGTLATLTGIKDMKTLDKIHNAFILFLDEDDGSNVWSTWQEAWKDFERSREYKMLNRKSASVSGFPRKYLAGVAEVIKSQIGRNTLMYVGANQFMKGTDRGMEYLKFKASGSKLKRGGIIRVLYDDGSDTYIVEGWRIRGVNARKIKEVEGVYADMLGRVIESITG